MGHWDKCLSPTYDNLFYSVHFELYKVWRWLCMFARPALCILRRQVIQFKRPSGPLVPVLVTPLVTYQDSIAANRKKPISVLNGAQCRVTLLMWPMPLAPSFTSVYRECHSNRDHVTRHTIETVVQVTIWSTALKLWIDMADMDVTVCKKLETHLTRCAECIYLMYYNSSIL